MTALSSEEVFAIWAPDAVLWSEWAKPIAFAQGAETNVSEPAPAAAITIHGHLPPDAAVIVDLPGADAVQAGLWLAERGFRPVPLFNGTSGPSPVVDVSPISRALAGGVERLKRATIPPDARPAFLLDARRDGGSATPQAGAYDNRWVVLPQDFPSGARLASRGIRAAILVRPRDLSIPEDLAHVLRRWHDSGIEIRVLDSATGQSESNVRVPKPSGFRLAWYAGITLLGLRRNNVGGFGSTIPQQTARGGFYG